MLVRSGFSLADIRAAPVAQVESWLRIIRDAVPRQPARPGAKPEPVKRVNKKLMDKIKASTR